MHPPQNFAYHVKSMETILNQLKKPGMYLSNNIKALVISFIHRFFNAQLKVSTQKVEKIQIYYTSADYEQQMLFRELYQNIQIGTEILTDVEFPDILEDKIKKKPNNVATSTDSFDAFLQLKVQEALKEELNISKAPRKSRFDSSYVPMNKRIVADLLKNAATQTNEETLSTMCSSSNETYNVSSDISLDPTEAASSFVALNQSSEKSIVAPLTNQEKTNGPPAASNNTEFDVPSKNDATQPVAPAIVNHAKDVMVNPPALSNPQSVPLAKSHENTPSLPSSSPSSLSSPMVSLRTTSLKETEQHENKKLDGQKMATEQTMPENNAPQCSVSLVSSYTMNNESFGRPHNTSLSSIEVAEPVDHASCRVTTEAPVSEAPHEAPMNEPTPFSQNELLQQTANDVSHNASKSDETLTKESNSFVALLKSLVLKSKEKNNKKKTVRGTEVSKQPKSVQPAITVAPHTLQKRGNTEVLADAVPSKKTKLAGSTDKEAAKNAPTALTQQPCSSSTVDAVEAVSSIETSMFQNNNQRQRSSSDNSVQILSPPPQSATLPRNAYCNQAASPYSMDDCNSYITTPSDLVNEVNKSLDKAINYYYNQTNMYGQPINLAHAVEAVPRYVNAKMLLNITQRANGTSQQVTTQPPNSIPHTVSPVPMTHNLEATSSSSSEDRDSITANAPSSSVDSSPT